MLNLEKLKALKIQSDPINNKGLKVVMKLYMPQLEKIWFENTNLSTDCGNSIAKMGHRLTNIAFVYHSKENSLALLNKLSNNMTNCIIG